MRFQDLEEKIGYTFQSHDLLKCVLTHRSYLNEKSKGRESNERLEFLGDAVLSLIVADYLFKKYPQRPEGQLTDLRSALVRRETLAKWATNFELGDFLFLGKGEAQTGGRTRAVTLAGAFEALLGAIFVEQGLAITTEWLIRIIEPELADILSEGRQRDFKGLLQKAVQNRFQQTPTYHVISESGLEHERVFEIEARIDNQVLGKAVGTTKQIAQQAAAQAALTYLESLPKKDIS